MELLLSALMGLPVYKKLLSALEKNRHVGLSGAAQLGRSHLIASLLHETGRPALILCQDEMAARRTQEELKAFLGEEIPILPARDLGFYSASAISRQFEQKRLKLLYELANGSCRRLIASWEALCIRTMPKDCLFSCAMELRLGMVLEQTELISALERSGYVRCSLVEGAGQYAVRGGIVDIYSPAYEDPIRVEFFGDEIDTMGFFDVVSQRRRENAERVQLLPVAERNLE